MKTVFFIHGLLGNHNEFNKLIKYLKKEDIRCVAPDIKGHDNGLVPPFPYWINEIDFYFNKILFQETEIYILGFSMGAILASFLLMKYQSFKIKGVIFINGAFKHVYYNNIESINKTFIQFVKSVNKKNIINIKKRNYIFATKELNKLSSLQQKNNWLKKYNKPTLIIQTLNDGFILSDTPKYIYNNIKTLDKEIKWYEGGHYFFNEESMKIISEDVLHFINRIK